MAASQALSVLGSIQAKPCVVQAYGCLPRSVCSGVLAEGAAASSSVGILDERLGNAQISQVQLYIAHNLIALEKRGEHGRGAGQELGDQNSRAGLKRREPMPSSAVGLPLLVHLTCLTNLSSRPTSLASLLPTACLEGPFLLFSPACCVSTCQQT